MRELGFVRIGTVSPGITVADAMANADEIARLYREASQKGCALIVFPELCITGYTCGDLFAQSTLLEGAKAALVKLLESTRDIASLAIIGLPLRHNGALYNCAAVIQHGRILGIVPKQHIPNYNEFYELRNFTSGAGTSGSLSLWGEEIPFGADLLFACSDMPDFILGVEICEDLWVPDSPAISLCMGGATVIANISASDELVGKDDFRRMLIASQSAKLTCAYAYADASDGESTTDTVFAGHNLIAENGRILSETTPFERGLRYADVDLAMLTSERTFRNTFCHMDGMRTVSFALGELDAPLERSISRTPFIPEDPVERSQRYAQILDIQAHGLAKRVTHTHCAKLVIGISGGLDSCLALLAAAHTMDLLSRSRSDVLAVTMPCFGTTGRTRSNAEKLCGSLGVSFREVNIGASVKRHFADIGHDFDNHNTTFENAQARERTQVLMDIANMENGLVIGTGDLSELALGWATYNGDHMSMYGVNGGIPKTLVRQLVRHYADAADSPSLNQVLTDILDTPVSPELLPANRDDSIAQVTEDLVGPYELHDFFLFHMLRHRFGPGKIFALARHAFGGVYSDEVILKWLRTFCHRFFTQQFKRSCLPDGPKVGSVSLSPRGDWRMPSDASSALWLKEADEIRI